MSKTMITYINQQDTTIRRILQEYEHTLQPLHCFAKTRQIKKVLILATGSSYNAALCARYYFMQQCGLFLDIKEPYNFTHYEPIDPHVDLVIVISQSGKSASTLAAQSKVQAAGIPVFTLTSDRHSPIAQNSHAVLDMNSGIETVGFVTMGFTATVVNLLLISSLIALTQANITNTQLNELIEILMNISQQLPSVIQKTEKFIEQYQDIFRSTHRFVAISYGALEGVVCEFSTKFTETVRLPSSGFELEAYMHGPYLEANSNHVLFFIEDQINSRLHALRDYIRPYVNAVFTLRSGSGDFSESENTLEFNYPIPHNFASVLLIIPVQVMSYYISTMKGIDLSVRIFDDFDHVLKSKI